MKTNKVKEEQEQETMGSVDDSVPEESMTYEEVVEKITRILFGPGINSTNRLPAMLNLLADWCYDPLIVWPVLHRTWNGCDVTWPFREELTECLDAVTLGSAMSSISSLDFLEPEDRAAYDSLPKHIRIFRGCSSPRIFGHSWTTDQEVAEQFVRGHRGIRVPDPVVVSVRIPKSEIIGFYTSREESEVFVNPDAIKHRSLQVRDFDALQS